MMGVHAIMRVGLEGEENEIKTNEEVNRQAEKTLQGSENLNSTSNELNQLVQKIDMEIERIK
jgi:hypothetical protein